MTYQRTGGMVPVGISGGAANDDAVLHKTGNETKTGTLTLDGIALPDAALQIVDVAGLQTALDAATQDGGGVGTAVQPAIIYGGKATNLGKI